MDIGVWMSPETLKHKLEARTEQNPEQTWNIYRWPSGLSAEGQDHRLFVATKGYWRGHFRLSNEALFNPNDATHYTLIFDTRTWTPIPPTIPVRRFRGFTYKVPTHHLSHNYPSAPGTTDNPS